MTRLTMRPARLEDAPLIHDLIDIATFGFAQHLFSCLAPPGIDGRSFMLERMCAPDSQLSLTKAQVAEFDGQMAGFVMTESLPDPTTQVTPDTPPLLRPLFELENLVPGTTLVNFVATYPALRGLGIGTALMHYAELMRGPNGMSLTIHDLNAPARRLYETLGFREVARRPIVKHGWDNPAQDWVLMVKP